jgi:hypothetical protein
MALVVDEGELVRINFGQVRIFKDTGKVLATCRRCPEVHTIEAGTPLMPSSSTKPPVAGVLEDNGTSTMRVRIIMQEYFNDLERL